MRSATVRRLALLTAILLLVPAGWRLELTTPTGPLPGTEVVRLASPGPVAAPALRRLVPRALALVGLRADHRTGLLAVAVTALLSLLRLGLRAGELGTGSAPASLSRRHAIALRAPPVLSQP